jgi:hypothetical protein
MMSAVGTSATLRRVPGLGRARLTPDIQGCLLVVGLVLLANLPYLLGVSEANPLGPRGGLIRASVPGVVAGQPWIDPNYGFVSQALGHRAALDLIHFHMPWWNPYEGTGAPLAGEMQSAALFPPTLLLLFSNGQIYEHVLLEMVAGVSTFLLLRRLGLGRFASVAGGSVFALNGTFAWFAHAPVNPIAFLPLMLLGIERAYTAAAESRAGGWWLIAIAGALSFYGGFPETAYIDTALAALWFAWRCGCIERARLRALAGKAISGAVVGVLITAPLLIASIDYFNHADLGVHASSLYGSAHIPAQGLPQLLLPYIYGPILGYAGPGFALTGIWVVVGGYLSTSLLMLAGLGLCARGRRGLRLVLGVWILLAFARMYGQIPLLGHVLGWLPGMGRVAFFRYGTASLELAVTILAALGIHDLVTVPEHRRRLAWGGLTMLLLVAVGALGAHSLASQLGPKYSHRPYFAGAIVWGAVMVIAAVVAGSRRDRRRRELLLSAVLVVDALALFVAPEASAPRSVQVDAQPAAFLARHLGEQRFFSLGPLQSNYGSYYSIFQLNITDNPIPAGFASYIHRRLDPYAPPHVFVGILAGGRSAFAPSPMQELERNLAGYRAAGVAYVLTPKGQYLPHTPGTFTLVKRTPTAWIYRLAGAAPFFDAPGCTSRSSGVDSLRATCSAPTRLVRRETFMHGWSASIDGRSTTIERAGSDFQAVTVPAGTHTVTFGYSPPLIAWGWLAFAAGLVALPFGSRRGRAGLAAAARRIPVGRSPVSPEDSRARA